MVIGYINLITAIVIGLLCPIIAIPIILIAIPLVGLAEALKQIALLLAGYPETVKEIYQFSCKRGASGLRRIRKEQSK